MSDEYGNHDEAGRRQAGNAQSFLLELQETLQLLASGGVPRSVKVRTYGSYETARGLATLISALGWLVIVVAAIAMLAGFSESSNSYSRYSGQGASAMAMIAGGIAGAILGVLIVAMGQTARASVDSADYAKQSLLIQKAIAEGRTEIDATVLYAPSSPVEPRTNAGTDQPRSGQSPQRSEY